MELYYFYSEAKASRRETLNPKSTKIPNFPGQKLFRIIFDVSLNCRGVWFLNLLIGFMIDHRNPKAIKLLIIGTSVSTVMRDFPFSC